MLAARGHCLSCEDAVTGNSTAGLAYRIRGARSNNVRGSFEHDLAGVATGFCPLFDSRPG